MASISISPSLMCMNLATFAQDLAFMDPKVESYHLDIMDGHYVKNITLSPWFVAQVRANSTAKLSVHFMVDAPQDFIQSCIDAGADILCMHTDVIERQAFRLINLIKNQGKKAGVVINPSTPPTVLLPYIHLLDKVTVMTVDPGFAGQKFVTEAVDNIRTLAQWKREKGLDFQIEVDGSCNKNTWKLLHTAGTEVFITGSSGLFNLAPQLKEAWPLMEKEINSALKG